MIADLLGELAAELALFASVGFLIIAADDAALDLLYFVRDAWRELWVYGRHRRAHVETVARRFTSGWMAVFVPAWNEADVIAAMLRATLERFDHDDYLLFVGHYPNDPASAEAILSVADPRIVMVEMKTAGPTSKADCLNQLYAGMLAYEQAIDRQAKAIVLHDAEDVVDPAELRLFDRLIEHAAAVQLPVVPLLDPRSRWIAGHYADEFAQAHGKDLVVREAVGAAIPLAGVGCAIERLALARLAGRHDGRPFLDGSLTEDYEMGLRLGALGLKTMFVRIAASPEGSAVVASRGYFPASLADSVRQKSRWIGGIAFSGWDRLGWRGGLGERWMRLRDRRAPFAALVMAIAYLSALLWAEVALAAALGAPVHVPVSPLLAGLLSVNGSLLLWRLLVRFHFTRMTHGVGEGLWSIPRAIVANYIAILATWRALKLHAAGGPRRWDKTPHRFPASLDARDLR